MLARGTLGRMTGKLRWAMCLFVVSGCSTKPRAPALQDETVYQNSQEGFRFLPPADWKQQARAEFPAGPVTEKLAAAYIEAMQNLL